MATTATVTRIDKRNTGKVITATSATSSTASAAEKFEFTFGCKDENAVILVKNGSVGKITASLEAAGSGNGFTPVSTEVATGGLCALTVESGFVKNVNGKVTLSVTPPSGSALSACGVSVYGIESGVVTH